MKSRALWMECGDDNLKNSYHFEKHRKNTVCKINSGEGLNVEGFEDKASASIQHYQNMFKVKDKTSLADIVRITQMFPTSVGEEENDMLMEEISLNELKGILGNFKHDKSIGPDGLPIEFYSTLFEVLGNDLLLVIEESKKCEEIPAEFNSTFLALIPKHESPGSFEDYMPISLCNGIYKIISKVISSRIKRVLKEYISSDQFGFLIGRNIQEGLCKKVCILSNARG